MLFPFLAACLVQKGASAGLSSSACLKIPGTRGAPGGTLGAIGEHWGALSAPEGIV
jgi:hypothetical protein